MLNLQSRLESLQDKIKLCTSSINSKQNILLLPASKKQSNANLLSLYRLGIVNFAENYVAEALPKIKTLPEDIQWHLIGPIQSNKTQLIAANFGWVHSIDRLKIIQRLAKQRPENKPPLHCLIQVNISADDDKAGAALSEVASLAKEINLSERLTLKGLMTITKQYQDVEFLKADFAKMQQASQTLCQTYPQANYLSMGMSSDFDLAIQYGANIVRIGTALFGSRD